MPFEASKIDRVGGIFPREIAEGLDERFNRLMGLDRQSDDYAREFARLAEDSAVTLASQNAQFKSGGFLAPRLGQRGPRRLPDGTIEELLFPLPPQFKGLIGPQGVLAPVDPLRLGLIDQTNILFRNMLDPRNLNEGIYKLSQIAPDAAESSKGVIAYADLVNRLSATGSDGVTPAQRLALLRDPNASRISAARDLFPRGTVGTGLPYPMALAGRAMREQGNPLLARGAAGKIRQMALPLYSISDEKFRFQDIQKRVRRFTPEQGLAIFETYAAVNERRAQEEVISALADDETIGWYKSTLEDISAKHGEYEAKKLDYFTPERRANRQMAKTLASSLNGMFADGEGRIGTSLLHIPSKEMTGSDFSKMIRELQEQGRRPFDPAEGNFQYEKKGTSIFNMDEAGFDLEDFNRRAVAAGAEPLVLPSGSTSIDDLVDYGADVADDLDTPGLGPRNLGSELRSDRIALAWDDFANGVKAQIAALPGDEVEPRERLQRLLRPAFLADRPEPEIMEDIQKLLDDPKALKAAINVDEHVKEALSDAQDRAKSATRTMMFNEGAVSAGQASLLEERLRTVAERSEIQKYTRGVMGVEEFRAVTEPKTGPRMAMEFAAESLIDERGLYPVVRADSPLRSSGDASRGLLKRFELAMNVVGEMYPEYEERLFFDESGKINKETDDFIRAFFTQSDSRAPSIVSQTLQRTQGVDMPAKNIANNLRMMRVDGDVFETILRRVVQNMPRF